MATPILTHPAFKPVISPVTSKRRRGRLPRGVVSIKSVPRLKVGILAELFDQERPEDNGKHFRVTAFDANNDGFHFECESLDGPIKCDDGSLATTVWMKPTELRRLWTGNTTPSTAGVL